MIAPACWRNYGFTRSLKYSLNFREGTLFPADCIQGGYFLLSEWKSMCPCNTTNLLFVCLFDLVLVLVFLDYSAFTCLIVCRQTFHSSEYLTIYLGIWRQISMFWENFWIYCIFFKKRILLETYDCSLLGFQSFKMLLRYKSRLKTWKLMEEKRVFANKILQNCLLCPRTTFG